MDRLTQNEIENTVAQMLSQKYGHWVRWSTIWLEVLRWSGMNRSFYSEDETSNRQMVAMYDGVRKLCEHEKARVVGYSVDDLHFYSLNSLRELVVQVCAGINSTRLDPAYADVERGLYKLLDPSNRATIIGVQAGWLEESETYEEALKALQAVLGGKRPKGL